MQQPQQQRFQQPQQPKVPEKKSNLWLIIIVIIILLALLWPVFRKSKAPVDSPLSGDETAMTNDGELDQEEEVDSLTPSVTPSSSAGQSVTITPVQSTPSAPATAVSSTIPLKVFFGFGSEERKPETVQCGLVFFVTRTVAATPAVARAALNQLISGPSEKELSLGFFTLINAQTTIKELTINNGVARVNFSSDLIANTETDNTCLEDGIRAQITETLKQFPTVRSVVILVNGVLF